MDVTTLALAKKHAEKLALGGAIPIPGPTGLTGPKGDKGDPGEKGDPGDIGPKGDPGDTGPAGNVGTKGDTGERGLPGEKGDKGDKGDDGAPGEKGEKGDKGDTGDIGPKGDLGDKGDKGDTGDQGQPGQDGAGIQISGTVSAYNNLPTDLLSADAGKAYFVSADGLLYIWDGSDFPANGEGVQFQGPKGDKGDQGEKGEPGEAGPKGDAGENGETGQPGSKGDQGEPGPKGDPGEKGDAGEKGDPGTAGERGLQGEPGERGLPGEKGEQGEPGPKGDPGEKGEPGEPGPKGIGGSTGTIGINNSTINEASSFLDLVCRLLFNNDGHDNYLLYDGASEANDWTDRPFNNWANDRNVLHIEGIVLPDEDSDGKVTLAPTSYDDTLVYVRSFHGAPGSIAWQGSWKEITSDSSNVKIDGGNVLTGSQAVVDNRNQVRRYTTVDSVGVKAQDDQAGKSVGFNAHGISFEDHNNGKSHSVEVEDGVLLFDGKPIGTTETGGGGRHQRIDAYPEEEYNQGQFWKIVSDSHQFKQDQLYVVDIEISNQGGSSRGTLFIGLADHGEGIIHHTSGQYLYSVEWHIENGEIQFHSIQAGNNGFDLRSVIHISTGGAVEANEFHELERITYWAASLTFVGWRRVDGADLEEGKRYLLKGAYWGDPFETTVDEYGWADLPNGQGVYIVNRNGQYFLEGGNQSNYSGIEIFSAQIGQGGNAEANVDVFSCLFHGERVKIERNPVLESMGITRYELTLLEVPNSLEKDLIIHMPLTKETLIPLDRLFGFSDGQAYDEMEWMIQEITDYCNWTGDFDIYGNDIYSGYEHIIDYFMQIMETLLMADSIDPRSVSGNADYSYETENGNLMTVYQMGAMGMKGANEIVIPLVKKKEGIF